MFFVVILARFGVQNGTQKNATMIVAFFVKLKLQILCGGAAGYCLRVRKIAIIPFYAHSLFAYLSVF